MVEYGLYKKYTFLKKVIPDSENIIDLRKIIQINSSHQQNMDIFYPRSIWIQLNSVLKYA